MVSCPLPSLVCADVHDVIAVPELLPHERCYQMPGHEPVIVGVFYNGINVQTVRATPDEVATIWVVAILLAPPRARG